MLGMVWHPHRIACLRIYKCMIKASLLSRLMLAFGAMLATGGLTGCEGPVSPPFGIGATSQAAPVPLAVMPGPEKTLAAFQQDDAACRAAISAESQQTAEQFAAARSSVVLATEAGGGPVGASSTPPSPPRAQRSDVSYANCMTSKQNVVR